MIFPKTNSYEKLNQPFLGITAQKLSKYGVFSSPYFPVFGLKTGIYLVNLRIYSVNLSQNTGK